MDFFLASPAVGQANTNQNICRGALCILDQDIRIFAVRKDTGIQQLVLERGWVGFPTSVLLNDVRIRKRLVRIFIEHLHVAVSRRIIQVKVILLHVFPMISFAVSKSEESLFENRVLAIPQRQRKAKSGFFVANAG
jgi:hypothetical protein